jgi:hypothetical protein
VAGIYSNLNPINRLSTNTNRAWTDANGNYWPDCDLLNAAAQDLRSGGGDFCGAWSAQNFGKPVFASTYDPDLIRGWYVRPYNWDFGASVTQALTGRMSVEVGYFRRIYGNFTVTDNRALGPADFTPFSVVAPADPRARPPARRQCGQRVDQPRRAGDDVRRSDQSGGLPRGQDPAFRPYGDDAGPRSL